jgi:hypothetical protein
MLKCLYPAPIITLLSNATGHRGIAGTKNKVRYVDTQAPNCDIECILEEAHPFYSCIIWYHPVLPSACKGTPVTQKEERLGERYGWCCEAGGGGGGV